jgi:hypothetical protein
MSDKIREAYEAEEEAYNFPYTDDNICATDCYEIAEHFFQAGHAHTMKQVGVLLDALSGILDTIRVDFGMFPEAEALLSKYEQVPCPECGGDGFFIKDPDCHGGDCEMCAEIESCDHTEICPNCQDGKVWREK